MTLDTNNRDLKTLICVNKNKRKITLMFTALIAFGYIFGVYIFFFMINEYDLFDRFIRILIYLFVLNIYGWYIYNKFTRMTPLNMIYYPKKITISNNDTESIDILKSNIDKIKQNGEHFKLYLNDGTQKKLFLDNKSGNILMEWFLKHTND